jgi:hypothetical protein
MTKRRPFTVTWLGKRGLDNELSSLSGGPRGLLEGALSGEVVQNA